MQTALEQYESMMQTHDPELYLTKKQLEDVVKRGFGTVLVDYTIQGGKIKSVERSVKLVNVSSPQTAKINILYWLDWIIIKYRYNRSINSY